MSNPSPPSVYQSSDNQKQGMNRNYLMSIDGLIRLALIVKEAFVFHFELIIGFKICLFTNNLRFSASPVGFLQPQQFRKMDPVYIMIRLFMEVRFVYI
jgi:hypothetical protein